jgi:hypothetical protein
MRPNVLLVTAANDAYHAATRWPGRPAARLDDVRVAAGVADAQQEERHRQQHEDSATAAVVRSEAMNMYA